MTLRPVPASRIKRHPNVRMIMMIHMTKIVTTGAMIGAGVDTMVGERIGATIDVTIDATTEETTGETTDVTHVRPHVGTTRTTTRMNYHQGGKESHVAVGTMAEATDGATRRPKKATPVIPPTTSSGEYYNQ